MAKLGIEVEGRYRGLYSVFVTPQELVKLYNRKDIINKISKISVIDNDSIITREQINLLMSFPERIIITLETPKIKLSLDIIPSRIHLILVIRTPIISELSLYEQIKFVNSFNYVYMIAKENMCYTHPSEFDSYEDLEL